MWKSQCTFTSKRKSKSIFSYFFMSSIVVSYVTRYFLSWNINGSNRPFGQLDSVRSPTSTSIIFTLRRASWYSPSEWSETYTNSLCDTVYVNLSPSKCHMNTYFFIYSFISFRSAMAILNSCRLNCLPIDNIYFKLI